jgi:hypothetical protein
VADTAPCRCWFGPVVIHTDDGEHCCFREDPTPLADMKVGVPPPCGHWVET